MPLTITFQLSDRDLELLGDVMNRAASKSRDAQRS